MRRLVEAENPDFIANANFKRDMFNILIGVITQTALVALPILIVIQQWQSGLTCLLVLVISALVLKKSWYDRLPD